MNNQWLTIEQVGNDVVLKKCSREAEGVIEIPENITHIADDAFDESNVIIKNLPIGLKAIGKNAFASCSFYRPLVNLPESLEKIGEGAFARTNIKGLHIPASVTQIDGRILPGTCKLVVVDEDNSIYDSRGNCNAIIETATGKLIEGCDYGYIPKGVEEICEYAFAHRTLMKVDLPHTLRKIGREAFAEVSWLVNTVVDDDIEVEIGIPSSVREIGDFAFNTFDDWYHGVKIIIDGKTDIKLGSEITCSPDDVEVDNEEIKWILENYNIYYDSEFPFEKIEEIPSNCLRYSIHQDDTIQCIPGNVKHICKEAFEGCTHLERVEIYNSDVKIDLSAFKGCSSLASIIVDDGSEFIEWDAEERDAVFFYANPYKFIVDGKLNVPDGVDIIPNSAFKNCLELTEVIIPESVEIIGCCAFENCKKLEKVTISEGVKEIGESAFSGCMSLQHVVLPDSVTKVDIRAFQDCTSLESIVLSKSLKEIEQHAFSGCSSLRELLIPASMETIWPGSFSRCSSLERIVVSEESTEFDSRENCNALIDTATNILAVGCKNTHIPPGIKEIAECAFCGCTGLTNIEIPDSVQYIGDWAFDGCTSLKSIKLPDSLLEIRAWTFRGCSSLEHISIPESVNEILPYAFRGCISLVDIVASDEIKKEVETQIFNKN